MSEVNITIEGGTSKRLLVKGTYPRNNIVVTATGGGGGGGAIDLSAIPEVDSIDNPTAKSPTAVNYNGEIYLLVEGEIKNG